MRCDVDTLEHAAAGLAVFLDPGEVGVLLDIAEERGGVREVTLGETAWNLEEGADWAWHYRLDYGAVDDDYERLAYAHNLGLVHWWGRCLMVGVDRGDYDMRQHGVPVATGRLQRSRWSLDDLWRVTWAGRDVSVGDYRHVARIAYVEMPKRPRGVHAATAPTPEHLPRGASPERFRRRRLDGRR